MSKVHDIENRKKIYNLIESNPGLNLSDISKILELKVQLVDYHTRYLETNELITAVKEEGFKRYYISGQTGIKDKKMMGVLRQEIPLKIVLFLLEQPHSKHKEILENFDMAPSTLTYHINKLVKNEIIVFEDAQDKKGYTIINKKEIINFLTQYKPSKILKRFKETWTDFHIP